MLKVSLPACDRREIWDTFARPLTTKEIGMHTVPTIPGVRLEVYKQQRLLTPEVDGYVGRLFSGFAVILAVVDASVQKTICIFRDGQDQYVLQKDLMTIPPLRYGRFPPKPAQQFLMNLLAGRSFELSTQVYGLRIPLQVDEDRSVNRVSYPENMLMLAQYCCGDRSNLTDPDRVRVWKVALVSQLGEFFLTVKEAYNVTVFQRGESVLQIPRFAEHRQLEQLLLANAPENFRSCSSHDDQVLGNQTVKGLASNEGVVERWYDARNMGCILTARGPARVHWSEVPSRPRRRFLVEGERVRIGTLGAPRLNPRTDWRKMRKSRFKLQAYGVKVS